MGGRDDQLSDWTTLQENLKGGKDFLKCLKISQRNVFFSREEKMGDCPRT